MAKKHSALQKEWKARDLRRIRNLHNGLHDTSTQTQLGYSKKEVIREEGEVWVEDGKQFSMKNGIKTKYSKLESLRLQTVIPNFCPSCKLPMRKGIDVAMFKLHKTCFNCVIDYEAKIKQDGKFKEYADKLDTENFKAALIDYRAYVIDYVDRKNTIITFDGDIEDWDFTDLDVTEVLKSIDDELSKL